MSDRFPWSDSDEVFAPKRTERWIGDVWLIMRENWGRTQYDDPLTTECTLRYFARNVGLKTN